MRIRERACDVVNSIRRQHWDRSIATGAVRWCMKNSDRHDMSDTGNGWKRKGRKSVMLENESLRREAREQRRTDHGEL